jgi:catalase-peroxidase
MHHASGTSSGGMQPPPTQHQWWPEQQNLLAPLFRNQVLGSSSHPVTHDEAAYRRPFAQLDLTAVERDLHQLMTTKEGDNDNFWPADYGHYGPFFIR